MALKELLSDGNADDMYLGEYVPVSNEDADQFYCFAYIAVGGLNLEHHWDKYDAFAKFRTQYFDGVYPDWRVATCPREGTQTYTFGMFRQWARRHRLVQQIVESCERAKLASGENHE